jgi:hypothetical protein
MFRFWIAGILFAAFSTPGEANDVAPALMRSAECMLKVLKSEPGVDQARLGTSNVGWIHPYLEYSASEKTGWVQPTRFEALKPADPSRGPYLFQAVLPGVLPERGKFDLHVTNNVEKRWKRRCGVEVLTLFN